MFNINKYWNILNDTQRKKLWAKDFIINYTFFQITVLGTLAASVLFLFFTLENDYHLFIGLISMDIFYFSVRADACLSFCVPVGEVGWWAVCTALHYIILDMGAHSLIQSGECLNFCCCLLETIKSKVSYLKIFRKHFDY